MWHILLIGFGAWVLRYNFTEFAENNLSFWQPLIAGVIGAVLVLGSFRCLFNLVTAPVRVDLYGDDCED